MIDERWGLPPSLLSPSRMGTQDEGGSVPEVHGISDSPTAGVRGGNGGDLLDPDTLQGVEVTKIRAASKLDGSQESWMRVLGGGHPWLWKQG